VLGQDAYGSRLDVSVQGSTVPVPQLGVGRLVETAAQANTVLQAYLQTSNGVVEMPDSALITGYGYLEDGTRAVADQLYAFYAEGRDLRRLVAIIGEAALSDEDRRMLDFAERFEETFVGQGRGKRTVQETLDLAWELLSGVPRSLLKRIPREHIDAYHQGEEAG
jgi:hypothetical protein